MCGISGYVTHKNSPRQVEDYVQKMNNSLCHRGPDDGGTFVDTASTHIVGLGHARLSILDLSPAGHQPMYSNSNHGTTSHYTDDSIAIVFNGEIYNYQDIRKSLEKKGYTFSTQTDTEVILTSYREYGQDCVQHFNGMRAFVIYDKANNVIRGSRDRLGEKPFYYYLDKDRFIFASELRSILESGIIRKLNIDIIPEFLTFHYTPSKQTLVCGVSKLPAGHNFSYDLHTRQFDTTCYRDINDDTTAYHDFEQAKDTLDRLLNDAVKLRTQVADVPVGTFLSGGLDSSLTSVLFKKYYQGKEFHTFNVVREDRYGNESEFADIVAQHIESIHHRVQVTGNDVLKELTQLQLHYSDPIAEAGFIPNYFVSRYAKQYVSVVLTGDGADEVFAGYEYYSFLQKLWKIGQLPGVKTIAKLFGTMLPPSKYQKGFELLSHASHDNFDRFFGLTVSNFSNKELSTLLTDKFSQKINFFDTIKASIKHFKSFLNQLQSTDQHILLQHCYNLKPDHALMARGLEGRAPFEDYRLLEFAYQIPDHFKINHGKEKYILSEVAKDYLPKEIFERKKQGYGVPIYEWITHELRDTVMQTLQHSRLVAAGYLHQKQIDYYLHHIDDKYLSTRIWTLYSLELFIEVYDLEIS